MKLLCDIQNLQLRLIESASVNENCAADLLSILRKLTAAEAKSVLEIIGLLQHEAEMLHKLSRDFTVQRYAAIFEDCALARSSSGTLIDGARNASGAQKALKRRGP